MKGGCAHCVCVCVCVIDITACIQLIIWQIILVWVTSLELCYSVSSTLPSGQLSNVPWRRTGVKYTNNEAYFDVVEEVDAIIDKAGSTVFAEIQGYVRVTLKLFVVHYLPWCIFPSFPVSYLQLIQNRYMFRSFTVLQCSHQHCVQPVASDVEVVGYL